MYNLTKSIILSLALLATSAFGYELGVINNSDGSRGIIHNPDEWVYAELGSSYKVYIEKSMIGHKGDEVDFHSVTEFNTFEEYKGLPYKIKRIYTYGVMSCKRSMLMIFVDMYTDLENTIRFSSAYQNGSYIVDMNETELRKQIKYMVCGDTI